MKKSKVSKVFLFHQVGNENEPPSYQEATAGYPEMEAQFAWDDKTIRRTFIRKVTERRLSQMKRRNKLKKRKIKRILNLTKCSSVCRFTPSSCSSLFFLPALIKLFYTHFTVTLPLLFFSSKTLSMAFMMGFVSSFYNTKSVMLCLGITALVCLSVTVFSFQSKIDVTSCQGVLFSLCMAMLLCAITISIVVPFGYVSSLVTRHLCSDRSHPLHSGKSVRMQPQTLMYHRSCGYRNKVYYCNYSYI
uniref:Protein lifeguard 2 n=1 Tax=Poecilia latipinna TaxID=48699 RepID=A0A3B3TIR5_9TELE